MPGSPVTNPTAKVFQALGCDLRLAILAQVNAGHVNTGEIPAKVGVCSSTFHKSLSVLERAGLVERQEAGWWRGEDQVGRYNLSVTPLAKDLLARVLREQQLLTALRGSRERAA